MRLHARLTPILTLLPTKKVVLTLRKTNKQKTRHSVATFTAQAVISRPIIKPRTAADAPEVWPTDLLIWIGPLTYLYESAHWPTYLSKPTDLLIWPVWHALLFLSLRQFTKQFMTLRLLSVRALSLSVKPVDFRCVIWWATHRHCSLSVRLYTFLHSMVCFVAAWPSLVFPSLSIRPTHFSDRSMAHPCFWPLYGQPMFLTALWPAHVSFWPLYGPSMSVSYRFMAHPCQFLTALWPTHVSFWPLYGPPMSVSDRSMAHPCQFLTALWPIHVSSWPLYGPPMSVSDRFMAHPCQFLTALWPTHVSFLPLYGPPMSVSDRSIAHPAKRAPLAAGRAASNAMHQWLPLTVESC